MNVNEPATGPSPRCPSGRVQVVCLGQLRSSTALVASLANQPFLPPTTSSAATSECVSSAGLCWPLSADPLDYVATNTDNVSLKNKIK